MSIQAKRGLPLSICIPVLSAVGIRTGSACRNGCLRSRSAYNGSFPSCAIFVAVVILFKISSMEVEVGE